jgi:hypothetical protein
MTKTTELLLEVAIAAPDTQGKYVSRASIPWDIVCAIRKHLEASGYDWRAAHRRYREILRERHARAVEQQIREEKKARKG